MFSLLLFHCYYLTWFWRYKMQWNRRQGRSHVNWKESYHYLLIIWLCRKSKGPNENLLQTVGTFNDMTICSIHIILINSVEGIMGKRPHLQQQQKWWNIEISTRHVFWLSYGLYIYYIMKIKASSFTWILRNPEMVHFLCYYAW